jgi:hypothetical protein
MALVTGMTADKILELIAAAGGSVDSVNGETGVVVLDAADIGAATAAQGAKADTAFQAEAYVAAPTGVFVTDTANILAAVNSLPTTGANQGGIVVFRAGAYSASLPARSNITWRGQGQQRTTINCPTGSMLTISTQVTFNKFEDLTLSTSGGHLINLGTTGYLALTQFRDCTLSSTVNTSALVHGTGACGWQEVVMEKCFLNMTVGATVSPFYINSSSGGINGNMWINLRTHGHLNNIVPFFHIEGTTNGCFNNTFKQITAEQCQGGVIKFLAPNGLTIEDVHDYDSTLYTASLVVIGKGSTANTVPRKIRLSNVGSVGIGGPAPLVNVQHVEFTAAPIDCTLERIGDDSGYAKVTYPAGYVPTSAYAPVPRTNWIKNPSAEVDTTNWTAANLTLTRDATHARYGSYAFKCVATGGQMYLIGPTAGVSAIPVTGGSTLYMKTSIWSTQAIANLASQFIEYDAAGATLSPQQFSSAPVAAGQWVDITSTFTLKSNTAFVRPIFGSITAPTVGDSYWLDGLYLGPVDGAYFDGSTADTAVAFHLWTGTAHASASREFPATARAAAIAAPPAPSAAYVQAEAAAMKTAVDAIRATLIANGLSA